MARGNGRDVEGRPEILLDMPARLVGKLDAIGVGWVVEGDQRYLLLKAAEADGVAKYPINAGVASGNQSYSGGDRCRSRWRGRQRMPAAERMNEWAMWHSLIRCPHSLTAIRCPTTAMHPGEVLMSRSRPGDFRFLICDFGF